MAKRYEWLQKIVDLQKPETVCEIGVHRGIRAEQMCKSLLERGVSVHYTGYDLWEFLLDPKLVGHGKGPSTRNAVDARLKNLQKAYPDYRYSLIQGDTRNTLDHREFDFVFLDGDHRPEAIQKDYHKISSSTTVVFDDWYTPEIPGMGANWVRTRPGLTRWLIHSQDGVRDSDSTISLLVVTRDERVMQFLEATHAKQL